MFASSIEIEAQSNSALCCSTLFRIVIICEIDVAFIYPPSVAPRCSIYIKLITKCKEWILRCTRKV